MLLACNAERNAFYVGFCQIQNHWLCTSCAQSPGVWNQPRDSCRGEETERNKQKRKIGQRVEGADSCGNVNPPFELVENLVVQTKPGDTWNFVRANSLVAIFIIELKGFSKRTNTHGNSESSNRASLSCYPNGGAIFPRTWTSVRCSRKNKFPLMCFICFLRAISSLSSNWIHPVFHLVRIQLGHFLDTIMKVFETFSPKVFL